MTSKEEIKIIPEIITIIEKECKLYGMIPIILWLLQSSNFWIIIPFIHPTREWNGEEK